ncbi:MAG: hypothetical protein QCI00_10170, partial [Candidatus Thermoplasmatota archaeon]|nr:hypothetical protein [Candidatus Thermoplasmatota archaeon]
SSADSEFNYITEDNEGFIAIRVPQEPKKDHDYLNRVPNNRSYNQHLIDPFFYEKKSKEILDDLRSYDKGSVSIDFALDPIDEVNELYLEKLSNNLQLTKKIHSGEIETFRQIIKEIIDSHSNKKFNNNLNEKSILDQYGHDNLMYKYNDFEKYYAELEKKYTRSIKYHSQLLNSYRRTLEEKPWERCNCPICQGIGIEVVIFRGNNRNRRRGFHNLKSFYSLLRNKEQWSKFSIKEDNKVIKPLFSEISSLEEFEGGPRTLVITACTKKKLDIDPLRTVPAKDLYQGTMFKRVQAYCKGKGYDYVIISARFGLLLPDDEVWLYEKFLKTKQDVEEIRPRVENKLADILPEYDRVLVIAGKNYREVLRNVIDDRFVFVKSKGIGDLISIVSKAIPIKDRMLEEFC